MRMAYAGTVRTSTLRSAVLTLAVGAMLFVPVATLRAAQCGGSSGMGECQAGTTCLSGSAEIFPNTCTGGVCCATSVTPTVSAASSTPASLDALDPLHGADILTVMGNVIKTFLGLVGAISLLAFVYGGVLYLTSAGEAKMVEKAKDVMLYTTIGMAILVFAYIISTNYLKVLIGS